MIIKTNHQRKFNPGLHASFFASEGPLTLPQADKGVFTQKETRSEIPRLVRGISPTPRLVTRGVVFAECETKPTIDAGITGFVPLLCLSTKNKNLWTILVIVYF